MVLNSLFDTLEREITRDVIPEELGLKNKKITKMKIKKSEIEKSCGI